MVLFYFWAVRSRKCFEKILLMSSLFFLGFVLFSFGFSSWFFLKTPPHTHLFWWFVFFFFVSRRVCLFRPFWAVRPVFRRFSRDAILGPARFWDFFESMGLELGQFFRGFFLDAKRQEFSGVFFVLVFFFMMHVLVPPKNVFFFCYRIGLHDVTKLHEYVKQC